MEDFAVAWSGLACGISVCSRRVVTREQIIHLQCLSLLFLSASIIFIHHVCWSDPWCAVRSTLASSQALGKGSGACFERFHLQFVVRNHS